MSNLARGLFDVAAVEQLARAGIGLTITSETRDGNRLSMEVRPPGLHPPLVRGPRLAISIIDGHDLSETSADGSNRLFDSASPANQSVAAASKSPSIEKQAPAYQASESPSTENSESLTIENPSSSSPPTNGNQSSKLLTKESAASESPTNESAASESPTNESTAASKPPISEDQSSKPPISEDQSSKPPISEDQSSKPPTSDGTAASESPVIEGHAAKSPVIEGQASKSPAVESRTASESPIIEGTGKGTPSNPHVITDSPARGGAEDTLASHSQDEDDISRDTAASSSTRATSVASSTPAPSSDVTTARPRPKPFVSEPGSSSRNVNGPLSSKSRIQTTAQAMASPQYAKARCVRLDESLRPLDYLHYHIKTVERMDGNGHCAADAIGKSVGVRGVEVRVKLLEYMDTAEARRTLADLNADEYEALRQRLFPGGKVPDDGGEAFAGAPCGKEYYLSERHLPLVANVFWRIEGVGVVLWQRSCGLSGVGRSARGGKGVSVVLC